MIKNCIICQATFIPYTGRAKCCASKICQNALRKIRLEKYRQNPEFIKKRQIACARYNNSEKRKKWVEENWKTKMAPKALERDRERRKTDKEFRIRGTLRRALGRVFEGKFKKTLFRKDVISYSEKELCDHLERQFKPGMTWGNYGISGWHIDHKKPMTAFQFFDGYGNINIDQITECMSLNNLQPLWYDENIRKSGANRLKLVQ